MVPGVFLGSYTNTYVPGPVYTNCDWTGTMPSFGKCWDTESAARKEHNNTDNSYMADCVAI